MAFKLEYGCWSQLAVIYRETLEGCLEGWERLTAPMIGGMVSSTILTLIVIPVLYFIWKRWKMSSGLPIDGTFAGGATDQ